MAKVTTLAAMLGQAVSVCSLASSRHQEKYAWDATDSAPEHYPLQIIQGTFYYHGESDKGLYIPSGGTLHDGWGEAVSSHVVGDRFKPLPDRMKIAFISFAEKQFYLGEFALPYEKIESLFRDGVEHPYTLPNGHSFPMYSRIMAGVAPGGAVAVWVTGKRTKEVFFGQAKKVSLNPGSAFGVSFENKADADAFIAKQVTNSLSPDEVESLKKNGIPFGIWERYRKIYHWRPVFKDGHYPKDIDIGFLNGEAIAEWTSWKNDDRQSPLPAPGYASFMTSFNDHKVLFTVTFDDAEIMSAFEKLGADGKKVYLEFEPSMPRTDIRIRLYNDKESIELKKFISKP